MAKCFFVTGTDTSIGKTYATCALLRAWQQQGMRAIGIKPVLTGKAELHTDTAALMEHNSIKLPAEIITPCAFTIPSSPHIAIAKENKSLTVSNIINACQPALAQDVEVILIEGIGGWYVPLNEKETLADLAAAFNYPIILVVGMRLGCLNHALLTTAAIQAAGLPIHGWIANQIEPEFLFMDEYMATLQARISPPLIGYIPHKESLSVPQWY